MTWALCPFRVCISPSIGQRVQNSCLITVGRPLTWVNAACRSSRDRGVRGFPERPVCAAAGRRRGSGGASGQADACMHQVFGGCNGVTVGDLRRVVTGVSCWCPSVGVHPPVGVRPMPGCAPHAPHARRGARTLSRIRAPRRRQVVPGRRHTGAPRPAGGGAAPHLKILVMPSQRKKPTPQRMSTPMNMSTSSPPSGALGRRAARAGRRGTQPPHGAGAPCGQAGPPGRPAAARGRGCRGGTGAGPRARHGVPPPSLHRPWSDRRSAMSRCPGA